MPHKNVIIILTLLFLSLPVAAQNDEYAAYALTVQSRLQQYCNNMQEISGYIASASSAGLKDLQHTFNSLDVRWNTYCSAQQGYIADNELMLALVAQYQQLRQMVSDSLAHVGMRIEAVRVFEDAEKFLSDKKADYDKLMSKCEKLAVTQQTAPQLERVQASEKLLFSEVSNHYQRAKDAISQNPSLKVKEEELDNLYLDLSSSSEKIQEIKYKPFIQRIKDYLLGFAAVAILLMFFSMLQNKIAAAKQMRESLKKVKEQYIKDGLDDIPSI